MGITTAPMHKIASNFPDFPRRCATTGTSKLPGTLTTQTKDDIVPCQQKHEHQHKFILQKQAVRSPAEQSKILTIIVKLEADERRKRYNMIKKTPMNKFCKLV